MLLLTADVRRQSGGGKAALVTAGFPVGGGRKLGGRR